MCLWAEKNRNVKTHNQTHKIYTQNMDTGAHKHTQGDYGAALLLWVNGPKPQIQGEKMRAHLFTHKLHPAG